MVRPREEFAPVRRLQTELEISDDLLGPLFDGLGHLLCSPNDHVVGRKKQDGMVLSGSQRVKTDRPIGIEDRAVSSVQCLPKVGDTCDVLGEA